MRHETASVRDETANLRHETASDRPETAPEGPEGPEGPERPEFAPEGAWTASELLDPASEWSGGVWTYIPTQAPQMLTHAP